MKIYLLIISFLSSFYSLFSIAGSSDSTCDRKEEFNVLQKINKGDLLDSYYCKNTSSDKKGLPDRCPDYHTLFDVSGDANFQKRIGTMIKELSEIEIGITLFNKLIKKNQSNKILIKQEKHSGLGDNKVLISLDEIDGIFIFNRDNEGHLSKINPDPACTLFHELTHLYYNENRKYLNKLIKDPFYTNSEELTTIDGDTKLFCLSKKDSSCKRKIYKLNENECLKQRGFARRYSHSAISKNSHEERPTLKNYYLQCGSLTKEDIEKKIKETNERKEIFDNIISLNSHFLIKFINEFKPDKDFLLELCQHASKSLIYNSESLVNGKFFETLISSSPYPDFPEKCLSYLGKNERKELLISRKDHFLLKSPLFLNKIKEDLDFYNQVLRSAYSKGAYNILNILLNEDKNEQEINHLLDSIKSSFVPSNLDYYTGDPCQFFEKVKPYFLKRNDLKDPRSNTRENFLFLASICKDTDFIEKIIEDKNLNIDSKIDILCKTPQNFLNHKILSIYDNFFTKQLNPLKDFIYDPNFFRKDCLWLLEKFSKEMIVYPLEYITKNMDINYFENQYLANTIQSLDNEKRQQFINDVREVAKKALAHILSDNSPDTSSLAKIFNSIIIMEKSFKNQEGFISCDMFSVIPEKGFLNIRAERTSYPNQAAKIIDTAQARGLKCKDETIPEKLYNLCTLMDKDDKCPYTQSEIKSKIGFK